MKTGRHGFTLLEVVLTIILFTIAIITIIGAINTGIFGSGDVENIRTARNILQAQMEEIRNTPVVDIAGSGPTADAEFPNISVTVAATGTDPKQVEVTAAWTVKGESVDMKVRGLRTQL